MNMASLFVILIVALLVIKPERLPEIARTLGRCLRMLKQFYEKTLHNLQI